MHPLLDLNVLYDAYKASVKGVGWKLESRNFRRFWLSEIVSLKKELEDRTYRTEKTKEFTLNERGKIRHIHGNTIRDRVVRHALCDAVLNPALHKFLIHNNGASQKSKGVSFSRKMFERDLHNYWLKHKSNDGYIGIVDLSRFYDNIRHDKLYELVLPQLDEFSQWLFKEVVDTFKVDVSYMSDEEYENCLGDKFNSVEYYETIPEGKRIGKKFMAKSVNIGDQVSQEIGIYFPSRIDNYVKIVRGIKYYGRYMDDMYVICETKEELKSVIDGIRKIADELGLFINNKKTHIFKLSDHYKYLQIKYTLSDTGKVIKRINPKAVTRERRKLKAYKRQLDKEKMTYETIELAYKSWMGSHYHIMSKLQIQGMRNLFKELFGKDPGWKKEKKR